MTRKPVSASPLPSEAASTTPFTRDPASPLPPRRPDDLDHLIEELVADGRLRGSALLAGSGALSTDRVADAVELGVWLTDHLARLDSHLVASAVRLPTRDLRRFGCEAILVGDRPKPTPLRRLVRFEAARARGYLAAGPELIAASTGWTSRLRAAIRVGRARAVLDRIEALDHDPLAQVVRPRPWRVVTRALRLLLAARRR